MSKHDFITTEEVSELTGIPVSLLLVWRTRKQGPAFYKLGPGRCGAVRYAREDVLAYIKNSRIQTTETVAV